MLLAVLVTGSLAREEVCYNNVEMACSSSSLSGKSEITVLSSIFYK